MGSVNCAIGRSSFDEPELPPRLINDEVLPPPNYLPGFIAVQNLPGIPNAIAGQNVNEMNDALHEAPHVAGQMNRESVKGLIARHEVIEIPDDDDDDDVVAVRNPAAVPFRKRSQNQHEAPAPQPNLQDVAVEPMPGPNGNSDPIREASPPSPQPWEYFDLEDYNFEDDYDLDNYFNDDEMLAQEMMVDVARASPAGLYQPAIATPSGNQQIQEPVPNLETRVQCVDMVLTVFPGICRDYVSELYDSVSPSSDRLIAHILDKMDKGTGYPRAKDLQKTLKRKRDLDEDEEAARIYGAADRVIPATIGGIRPYIRNVLSIEFPETPMTFIDNTLGQSGFRLFSTYRVLEEAHRTFDPKNPPYNKIKHQRKPVPEYLERNLDAFIATISRDEERADVLRELQAARRIKKKADEKREADRQLELDEEANVRRSEEEGTMQECGCCFCDYPLNRMVHCNNDTMHWFCRGCARQTAETEIGNSKYELHCMSMDGCDGGFSLDQRNQFLDEKTTIALERNEQEAVLRMAGIENLASCPFCPYAAEYPPVEIDREFRCQAPDCEKISCRLCKLESHIPKSCDEYAKDQGLSIRRQIEEAMSAALIRKCNKCGTPFVKEEGCNKMTCTRNGCYNVQCYVCSKSCAYDHFDDSRRGGKPGNCPLFESVEQRHDDEVKAAERLALEKVRAEHPEYAEEDLKIRMSENVQKDDERRKSLDPRARVVAMQAAGGNRAAMQIYEFPPVPYPPPALPQANWRLPPFYFDPHAAGLALPVMPPNRPEVPPFLEGPYGDVLDGDEFAGFFENLPGLPHPYPPPAPQLRPMRLPHVLPHRAPAPAAAANQGNAAALERPANQIWVRNRFGQIEQFDNVLDIPVAQANPPVAALNAQNFLQRQQAARPAPPAMPQRRHSQPAQNQNQGQGEAPNAGMDNAQVQLRLDELARQEQDVRQQLLMAQQQRIVDHAERRVQRQQHMARLRREEEVEEAVVVRALGDLRRVFPGEQQPADNGGQVGVREMQPQEMNQILRRGGSRKGK